MNPPLGLILPSQRTPEQRRAHEDAMSKFRNFAMPGYQDPPKGTKIMLTDFWKHPLCIADMGMEFTGFGQFTGSCVGVSDGDAIVSALCTQRVIGTNPTRASIVFWLFPYGRTRFNEGDRGQGEGAVDSVMGDTVVKEGFFDINQPNLPAFTQKGADGFWLSKAIEMAWSDGAKIAAEWKTLAAPQAGTTKTIIADTVSIRASIINGYPVLDGCNNYVGHGTIASGGGTPYVVGHYDGSGGHSTCFLGVWNHPNDGWLYLYSNQWPTSTYPKDPAEAGRCCVWLTEATVAKLFTSGGDKGETMSYASVPGQPAQPALLDYLY